jgi:transcriptional regulator with XRE-family HTH domain
VTAAGGISPPIGEAGRNLIANVQHLRRVRRLSLRDLSAEMGRAGRPVLPVGLSRLENAQRRVDVDDLVALATVLGVTPADLLLPPDAVSDPAAGDHPALRETRNLAARIQSVLTEAGDAGPGEHAGRSLKRALKLVHLEVDELLEDPMAMRKQASHDK